jgi:hypothetical protein
MTIDDSQAPPSLELSWLSVGAVWGVGGGRLGGARDGPRTGR